MQPGQTFLLPKPGRIEHLWVVLTYPNAEGLSICVNITTRRFDSDDTLILQPGDHPFIKHESTVHYEDARFMDLSLVTQLLESGAKSFVCEPREYCTHTLLDNIKDGLVKSRRTPTGIKRVCKELWGIR
jgi:hypothetical protein